MSPTKKRQTMGKITRERELKERRALKQEKKDERKLAATMEDVEVSEVSEDVEISDVLTDDVPPV